MRPPPGRFNRARPFNVRVLAATNRDLLADVHAARFRQDLYYRLRVVEIVVSPQRERRADIVPLARQLLARAVTRFGRKARTLSPEAANLLLQYTWPRNVRELENALERAVALARSDRIGADDLPEEVGAAPPTVRDVDDVRTLAEIERDYIAAALRASAGNRAKSGSTVGHWSRDAIPEAQAREAVSRRCRYQPPADVNLGQCRSTATVCIARPNTFVP